MSPELLSMIRELAGTDCRCGKQKQPKVTFCGGCYGALPRGMKNALYRRVGAGYEEAYRAAVEYLTGIQRGKGAA